MITEWRKIGIVASWYLFWGSTIINSPRRIQLEKTMEDYLEPKVENRYFVKTEKAERLIKRLIDEGQIEPGIIQIEETEGGAEDG